MQQPKQSSQGLYRSPLAQSILQSGVAQELSCQLRALAEFLRGEDGAIYPTTSFLMATLVISIPLGFVFMRIYFTLCDAGRIANALIGLS